MKSDKLIVKRVENRSLNWMVKLNTVTTVKILTSEQKNLLPTWENTPKNQPNSPIDFYSCLFQYETYMKTIFPTAKPFLNEKQDLFLPKDILWPGDTGLTLKETMYLIAYTAGGDDFVKVLLKNYGKPPARTSIWRLKKSLQEKGYLWVYTSPITLITIPN